jgi:predicted amidohydrolase YtcJ
MDQRLTRGEALAILTSGAAYAAFGENERGTIAVGKLADFSVFSADLMKIPGKEIPRAQAVMTVIGGDVVYDAAAVTPPNAID